MLSQLVRALLALVFWQFFFLLWNICRKFCNRENDCFRFAELQKVYKNWELKVRKILSRIFELHFLENIFKTVANASVCIKHQSTTVSLFWNWSQCIWNRIIFIRAFKNKAKRIRNGSKRPFWNFRGKNFWRSLEY